MTAALSTDALAKRVAKLERRLASLSGPQLAYSSIEDGAVNEYDIDGQLSSTIGKQYDGTHGAVVLAGPNPPTPFGAIVTSIPVGILVRWEGGWADSSLTVAPLDFTRVEVHVSTDPNFTATFFSTMRATIESPRGGDVQVPIVDTETPVYVRLVARAASGKASLASAVTGPVLPGKVPTAAVDIDWDSIGGNTIFVGNVEPVTNKIGDLWLREPDNIAHRWDGTSWVELRDQGVVQAISDAYNAQQAASQAGIDALAAKNLAGTKITVYRQASPPTGGTYLANSDLWIDSDDNKLYIATTAAGAWTSVQDTAISTAITNAATAQSTADGAVRFFFQDSPPTGLNNTTHVGDMWVETDNGNRPWSWDGAAWTDKRIGNAAISPNSLVASNVVATGTITAALLETQLVLASTIIAGNPNSGHARMTSAGFFAYAMGPDGPYIATKLGTTDNDTLTLTDSAGTIKAAIDTTGKIVGRSLSVQEWPIVGGIDLKTYIDDLPRGIKAWGEFAGGSIGRVAEGGDCMTSFWAEPGRMYQIVCGPIQISSTVGGDWGQIILRYTTNGTDPAVSDDFISYAIASHNNTLVITSLFQSPAPVGGVTPVKILVTHGRNFGSGSISAYSTRGYLAVTDVGKIIPPNMLTGGSGGAPQVNTYETDFSPTWWRTWRGNDSLISMGNDLYQGYEATNGNMKSMVGFPDMTPTISGATINKIWVYVYAEHWWNASGGIPVIGAHPNLSDTVTWPSGASSFFSGPAMARGEGRWIELPSTWHGSFLNGATRGLVFGPGWDNNAQYYGRFDAPSMRIRINYTK